MYTNTLGLALNPLTAHECHKYAAKQRSGSPRRARTRWETSGAVLPDRSFLAGDAAWRHVHAKAIPARCWGRAAPHGAGTTGCPWQRLQLSTAAALSPRSRRAERGRGFALGGTDGVQPGGNRGPAEPGPSCRG